MVEDRVRGVPLGLANEMEPEWGLKSSRMSSDRVAGRVVVVVVGVDDELGSERYIREDLDLVVVRLTVDAVAVCDDDSNLDPFVPSAIAPVETIRLLHHAVSCSESYSHKHASDQVPPSPRPRWVPLRLAQPLSQPLCLD